jgi:hypothetical protein
MARANSVRRSPAQLMEPAVHKSPVMRRMRACGDRVSFTKVAGRAFNSWSAFRLRGRSYTRIATFLSETRSATFLFLFLLATTPTASPAKYSLAMPRPSGVSLFAPVTADVAYYILAENSIEEIWKKSQSLRSEPSTDTTPVTAKVGEIVYSIPRNYIPSALDFPVLKVTYPGFKPLTDETRGCFDPKVRTSLGCTTLELHVRFSDSHYRGYDRLIRATTPDHSMPAPRPGPYGYEIFDLGPENARTEIYQSKAENIFFSCMIFDNNGIRDAVCEDLLPLSDGNVIRFFFNLKQISELRDFESGIRQLMSKLRTGEKQ